MNGDLGHQRQTFMLRSRGWDTHGGQLEDHGNLLLETILAVGACWAVIT